MQHFERDLSALIQLVKADEQAGCIPWRNSERDC